MLCGVGRSLFALCSLHVVRIVHLSLCKRGLYGPVSYIWVQDISRVAISSRCSAANMMSIVSPATDPIENGSFAADTSELVARSCVLDPE